MDSWFVQFFWIEMNNNYLFLIQCHGFKWIAWLWNIFWI